MQIVLYSDSKSRLQYLVSKTDSLSFSVFIYKYDIQKVERIADIAGERYRICCLKNEHMAFLEILR